MISKELRQLKRVNDLSFIVGKLADGRLAIFHRMINDIEYLANEIYWACSEGQRAKAFRLVAKLKAKVTEYESVTAILAK